VWTKVPHPQDEQTKPEVISDDDGLDIEEDEPEVDKTNCANHQGVKSYYNLKKFPEEAITLEAWMGKLEKVLN
jgi:hypothetical protein